MNTINLNPLNLVGTELAEYNWLKYSCQNEAQQKDIKDFVKEFRLVKDITEANITAVRNAYARRDEMRLDKANWEDYQALDTSAKIKIAAFAKEQKIAKCIGKDNITRVRAAWKARPNK